MIIEARVPEIGESINEVTLNQWLVEDGDYVEMDQSLCEFDSDKATLEFPAEKAGVVTRVAEEGADLKIGDVVCTIDTSAERPAGQDAPASEAAPAEKSAPEPTNGTPAPAPNRSRRARRLPPPPPRAMRPATRARPQPR